jgi:cell division protein FtsZ
MLDKKEINVKFDLPKDPESIIKVIGVGGGGSNAVNHMFRQGIKGVDFIICNTDQQALDASPVPSKIQLGSTLTEGRGAGAIPEVGKNAAIENIDELKKILANNTKMVFVTAGMGGGTGTGAAPVIATAAKEMGILTVGIVTIPFKFEGSKRRAQAEEGLNELRNAVDTLLVISNDKLREIFGNLSLKSAFEQADNVLTTAAKGIAEIITVTGYINVDFADVQTVMTNGGAAIMGSAMAEGENRAMRAAELALASPLLNDNKINGAKHILINITCGNEEVQMDEIGEIIDFVQEEAGANANVIFGTGTDNTLGDKVCVTLIATGFETGQNEAPRVVIEMEKTTANLPQRTDSTTVSQINSTVVEREAPKTKTVDNINDSDVLIKDANSRPELQFTFVTNPENKAEEKVNEFKPEDDEQVRRSKERLENLKLLSTKIKTPTSISELENVPAFRRRNVKFENVNYSSDNNVSRYTLNDNPEDKTISFRPNNSFLHDNVD